MKTKFFLGITAVFAALTLSLTSCGDDNPEEVTGGIKIDLKEVGHDNSKEGLIGKDLHVEADVNATEKIKSITVKIMNEDKKEALLTKTYGEGTKYTGIINTEFHEHLDLSKELKPGTYVLLMEVTDMKGNQKTAFSPLTLKEDVKSIKIEKLEILAEGKKLKQGQKVTVKASITTEFPVKEIAIVLHGDKKEVYPVADYNKNTGTFSLNKEITIKEDMPVGDYDVHLVVKDEKGNEKQEEIEDVHVEAK